MTPFEAHREKWKNCERCDLCKRRGKVVLVRGVIPCDVLFVGEAPGVSEDVLGRPFVGPAGKLLDFIVNEACKIAERHPRIAYTNIIACIPKGDEGNNKIGEPPQFAVKACRERLDEIVELCHPRLVVLVGKFASKYAPYQAIDYATFVDVVHPAAILRADVRVKEMNVEKAIAILVDALEEL